MFYAVFCGVELHFLMAFGSTSDKSSVVNLKCLLVIVKCSAKSQDCLEKIFTCWSDPSWFKASREELMFCTLPACAFFLTWVLPRFFTFGLGVTETNLLRDVVDDDDDMLLVLLVAIVLFGCTLVAVMDADSVDCEFDVAMIIFRRK